MKGRQSICALSMGIQYQKCEIMFGNELLGTTRTDSWFLIGDFNEITGNHEKQGGR